MLTDGYLRRHDYLRVSITDKCNLRCSYCMPPEGVEFMTHDQVLRNEEFVRLTGLFISMGVKKVRFTGGEPLIRKGFIDIVSGTRERHPDVELCLTTNGILLHNFIDDLAGVKLKKLNVSLDSLLPGRFEAITGVDCLDEVLANVNRAIDSGHFDVKINSVLFKETVDEIEGFLDYFKDKDLTLRFIEKMPFAESNRPERFLPSGSLIEKLDSLGALERISKADTNVAKMYKLLYKGGNLRIGVIPPMSHKFCSSCNRLRLTSDGHLKTCLHSDVDHDLKGLLRSGAGDDIIKKDILDAVVLKNEGHSFDCNPDDSGCASVVKTGPMSRIGG